jgi:hypothetical protein
MSRYFLVSSLRTAKGDFRRAAPSVVSVSVSAEQKSFYHLKAMTQESLMLSIPDDVDPKPEIAKK